MTPIRVSDDLEQSFPMAEKAATEVVLNLVRAEWLVTSAINRRLRRAGLSLASFNVLMILDGDDEPLCPADIGERLLVTRGTVTGLLDSLEKQGLIQRLPHPDDRRMLRIEITKKAEYVLNGLLPHHFKGEVDLLSGLTAREKETLIRLLGKVQDSVAAATDA